MDSNVNGSLLVIGNGFDKNCGLASSFSDFFKTVDINKNVWYLLFSFAFIEQPAGNNANFINLIKRDDILWMDIEDFIKRILYMHRENKNEKLRLLQSYGLPTFCEVLNDAYSHRNNPTHRYMDYQFSALRSYFNRHFTNFDINFDIVTYLYEELIAFEEDFKKYIETLVSNNKEYLDISSQIIRDLVGNEEACDILTFNYTTPDIDAVKLFAYGNINHIHGNLDTGVIIGFDTNDLTDGLIDGKLKMSKAWQKMFKDFSISYLPMRSQIASLKIYGHSLGDQDYSYFYSLFDYYDLYNSKIVLEFFYTPYQDTDEKNEIVRSLYVDAIYKLLNMYVSKTENASKGNIVVNKLILENRLKISKINKYH